MLLSKHEHYHQISAHLADRDTHGIFLRGRLHAVHGSVRYTHTMLTLNRTCRSEGFGPRHCFGVEQKLESWRLLFYATHAEPLILTFKNLDLAQRYRHIEDTTHANVTESDRATVLPQMSETAKDALTLDDASFLLVPSFVQARGHARNSRMSTELMMDRRVSPIWCSTIDLITIIAVFQELSIPMQFRPVVLILTRAFPS
jgi:hypothetical protein